MWTTMTGRRWSNRCCAVKSQRAARCGSSTCSGLAADDIDSDAIKADSGFRARHAKDFERVAVVTDESWIKPALRALSFLMPGAARGFAVHDLPAAKTWLAEGLETSP